MKTTATPAEPRRAGPSTLRGEIAFLATALRLALSLGYEGIHGVLSFCVFIFRRRRLREKVRRIMFHGQPPAPADEAPRRPARTDQRLVGPAAALLLIVLALAGCSSAAKTGSTKAESPHVSRGTSGSFKRQVHELGWSAKTLADQSDARQSLELTLEDLRMEDNWWKNLRFDVVNLFGMPDARRSLESDLHDLSGKDDRGHGIWETLQLFGW